MKKYSLIPMEIGYQLGISVGTAFRIVSKNRDDVGNVELLNVVYLPKTESFIYNKAVQLPKKLITYFESQNRMINRNIEEELASVSILPVSNFEKLVKEYETLEGKKALVKQKIMELTNKSLVEKKD